MDLAPVVFVQAVALCVLCVVIAGLAVAVVPLWWRVWRADVSAEANRVELVRQRTELDKADVVLEALLEWREGYAQRNNKGG